MRSRSRQLAGLFIIALVLLLTARAESALLVTNSNDSGEGSLRAAVAAATDGEIILFDIPTSDAGFDSSTGRFTITLTSGEIAIDKDLIIAGSPAARIAISGNHASRIFHIRAGRVRISDLTLTNGRVVGSTPREGFDYDAEPARGGAVLNEGALTCTRCSFENNSVKGGDGRETFSRAGTGGDGTGGAIHNQNELSLVACTLAQNSAEGGIGGISGFGTARYRAASGIAAGGAVYNAGGASISLSNCTITNNIAKTSNVTGGNAVNRSHGPADARGGGVANLGSLVATHTTIARNTAAAGLTPEAQPYGYAFGGGLYVETASASVRDSIFALNRIITAQTTTWTGAGPDVNGAVASEGHNLLGRSDGSSGFREDDLQGGTTEETGLDPRLGELGNHGGPTETVPLSQDSPAINAADTAGPTRDQRGFLRNGQPDIGAFEFDALRPAILRNISTRAHIRTGDAAMIGGFIITGSELKTVVIRALGPSLSVAGALEDPRMEVYDGSGQLVGTNDNWTEADTRQQINESGLAPTDAREAALYGAINPGTYTVVVRGKADTTGVGLVEVYDLAESVNSALGNISTRGLVETGDNVMIGGFIVRANEPRKIVVRALGPSLPTPGALPDPALELYDANGATLATNDNWRSEQAAEIEATTLAPSDDAEATVVRTLSAGAYTAVVRGARQTTGIALVEVYALD